MKKIITTIIMLICISTNINSNVITICDKLNVENISNYINKQKDYNFNNEQLGEEIGLNNDTIINESYNDFCQKMKICNMLQDNKMRKSLLYSSISEIIDNMHQNLNDDQYRQFLIKFNIMMYKHGFLKESSEYCDTYVK